MREHLLVNDDETLLEVVHAITAEPVVALDTEFVRESTYYPKLCLIQVATTGMAASVDCLARIELPAFLDSLLSAERTWVVHSARQDLEVVWLATGRTPAAIIDTQIAASLAGFTPQLSLQALLAETLGVELGKGFARTDWSRRPLPEDALRYALDDVRYLLPLWQHLEDRLRALGRLAWFEEDTRELLAEQPVTGAMTIWARLKGGNALTLQQQCAALALVRWRERTAQRLDRPRRWIMSDEILVRIARAQPRDAAELGALPEMPPRLAARAGAEILAALREHDAPDIRAAVAAANERAQVPLDKDRLNALKVRVKKRARELGIHPEVLATRRDLTALIADDGGPVLTGWRAEVLRPLLD